MTSTERSQQQIVVADDQATPAPSSSATATAATDVATGAQPATAKHQQRSRSPLRRALVPAFWPRSSDTASDATGFPSLWAQLTSGAAGVAGGAAAGSAPADVVDEIDECAPVRVLCSPFVLLVCLCRWGGAALFACCTARLRARERRAADSRADLELSGDIFDADAELTIDA